MLHFTLSFSPMTLRGGTRVATRLGLILALSAVLGACGSFNNASTSMASLVSPYKVDVVQGNFVSKEQAAALKPGMSRNQVRDMLGTPLLVSLFHADRWDYVFTFNRKGAEPQARKVTVFFKGDLLERYEADELPTEAEFVASLDSGRKVSKVPVLEATEESLSRFARPTTPVAVVSDPKVLPPLPDKYPPLEPATR
jgi:outer membrane protein assembly factor BamE